MNWRFWTSRSSKLGDPKEDHSISVSKPLEVNLTVRPGETIIWTYKLTLSADDLIKDREYLRASCLFKAERAVNRLIDGIKIIK